MNNLSDIIYDAEIDDNSHPNYYIGLGANKIEVYKKYLKNLNLSSTTNLSDYVVRNYAKMLFTTNSTTQFDDNVNNYEMNSDVISKSHSFSAANSMVVLIVLTVIYVIIFVLGVLGNVITCIVIAKNKSMHTAVNFYLFSLAVSDLLLLLSALPDEVYMLWFPEYPFNETICKVHKFAAESFTNATVFTITAFTIERYVAICKPFLSHTLSKLSRAYKFILGIWMISMCLAVPQTLFTLHLDEVYRICIPKQEHQHLFVISTFLLFVIPMSVITVLYILIGLQLRKSKIVQRGAVNGSSVRLKRKIFKNDAKHQTLVTINSESHYNEALIQQQHNQSNNNTDLNKEYKINSSEQDNIVPEDGRINYSSNRAQVHHGSRHVVNMLVVVVITFFLCWFPFHIQRLLFTYIEHSALSENVSFSVNTVSGVLFFVSTCINPFLYNIMSAKFRDAFKVTISKYIYSHQEDKVLSNRNLIRSMSQHSYSLNSTSLNTCSSICPIQPFSASSNQQMAFRYFDSKRPLVVSFRRANKMTQGNFTLEHCRSVSDFQRVDKCCISNGKNKRNISHDKISLKALSKYDGCGVNSIIINDGLEANNNCFNGNPSRIYK
ncbi:pyrokinin-1 receptor-like isoform X1 [Chironomus tepperi]|uniref:pyrokinin-1 receptor-like isoform X1 n=1 Tax=Chironomus tepperi TaxID=113505 RepID=UPI00391F9168